MSTIDRIARRLLARAAAIGADPRDDDEARIRKALLVVIAILILPISLVWGTLFIGLGAPSGAIAYLYFAISVVAIAFFARTRNARAFLRVELLDILLAPTISMAFVGGFLASRRRRALGHPRTARGPGVRWRPCRRPLVRRVRDRVPGVGDRG